jgi:hypothetical protein
LILDSKKNCVGCFKIAHPVCGRELDEDGNNLCFACDTKPETYVASVDSSATLSDVSYGVLAALEEDEAYSPLPILWSASSRSRPPHNNSSCNFEQHSNHHDSDRGSERDLKQPSNHGR